MIMQETYVIGIDFGTDSVRALVVDTRNGRELGGSVVPYPRWKKGLFCNPDGDQFRQHPLDYLESMTRAVKDALRETAGKTGRKDPGRHVVGLGVDTTGSTPVAVDCAGVPLSLTKGFEKNPNAMFILWKDHTGVHEAARINAVAHGAKTDYTRFSGGVYSSEWYFSKILHVLRHDPKVRRAAHSWVEHCDWIVGVLVGNTRPSGMARSRCAAGHKAMWHASWRGLPPQGFLSKIDPVFKGIRTRLFRDTRTSDECAGNLTQAWAGRLGLHEGVKVAVGAFDAHMGAVGAGIKTGVLSKIIGTSTCDMVIAPQASLGRKPVGGICGQVDGSIVPGYVGLEAGQSSVGDAFAWYRDTIRWSIEHVVPSARLAGGLRKSAIVKAEDNINAAIYQILGREAEQLKPGEAGVLALDWFNGRRTPYADQMLRGALIGMHLGTRPGALYRGLIESVAFGSRAIMDRFLSAGVDVQSVIACGGLSKVDLVMQIHSDVMGVPIRASASEQTCALGAAVFAAVSAGVYGSVEQAQRRMCPGFRKTYKPDGRKTRIYDRLYAEYHTAGGALAPVMRTLTAIQEKVR